MTNDNVAGAVGTAMATGDPLIDMGGKLFEQGALGLVIFILLWMVIQLRTENRESREAHKAEIAAKDATILGLQESRLSEVKTVIALVGSVQSTLDAVLATFQAGARK